MTRHATPRVQVYAGIATATLLGAIAAGRPEIAVLGGRRVLRAPTLLVADDDDRRDRAEDKVLRGRALGKLGGLYGLTHVFIAPGDFLSFGIAGPEELEKRGRFRLRYRDSSELRVYELE